MESLPEHLSTEHLNSKRLNIFSPEIFLPLFVALFYLAGLLLVSFSFKALSIVLIGIIVYLLVVRLIGRIVESWEKQNYISEHYFEHLLISLLIIFLIDLALRELANFYTRVVIYAILISAILYLLGRIKISLQGVFYLGLGLAMILIYVVPSFALYGLYGAYINRVGGLMPAFLVGIGTIAVIYGLMKISSSLTKRSLFAMVGFIVFIAGPLMAAAIGYRAYAIIFIMPLIFQYYLERQPPSSLKAGLKAAGVILLIFAYTYFLTSYTRGVLYMAAPLDSVKAPPAVVEAMEKGSYTDKDMIPSNPQARNRFLIRPFFTYKVFLDVIEDSFPWGRSHGKLTVSLMPGANTGRAMTISILKKPFSISFFGIPFLEFGFTGVAVYAALLGLCLAAASRLKDPKVYSLILTIIMLWLDTGPSVWWHWLPFGSAMLTFAAALLVNFIKPKVASPKYGF
ncbi:MAG: hypothetical protein QME63_03880 [Actinomycetota bacterium]|nr:hypothetical protein [Actinomycetota bacterium]